jgi:hypothetical protein
MRSTKIRIGITALAATFAAVAVAGPVVVEDAKAAPRTVKVGSSGNAKLDNICKQMGDLINEEIANGNAQEANGNYGEAQAWHNLASEHTARAQKAGCVMSIKAPRRVLRVQSTLRVSKAAKISATAGKGKGNWSQSQCDDFARWANDALKKSTQAAQEGDADLAKAWRDVANDTIATGRKGGCTFSAALMSRLNPRHAQISVGGTTARR